MGRRLRGKRKPDFIRKSSCQLSDVSSLSGGEQQKASYSQVLSTSPSNNFVSSQEEKCPTSSSGLTKSCDRQPQLQPITSFSSVIGFRGDVLPSGVSSGTNGGNIISNSSVIEILVHLLCREREPNHTRRELLFKALCNGIKKWNNSLYLPLHAFPELQDFRVGLLKKFEFLFEEVQNQITSDPSKLIIPSIQLPPTGSPLTQLALTDTRQNQFLDDRYSREFTELSVLGKGGFGVVVKARNKLDGCEYAVKIIIMHKPNSEASNKLLREVQALAQLSHPNIVRYHSTWLQLFAIPPHLWPKYQNSRAYKKQQLHNQSLKRDRINLFLPPPQVRIEELSSSSEPDDWEESSGGIVFADISRNKSPLSSKKPSRYDIIVETGESSYGSNAEIALSRKKDNVVNCSTVVRSELRSSICSSFHKSEFSKSNVETEHNYSIITKEGSSFSQALIPSNTSEENSVCKVPSGYSLASSLLSSSEIHSKKSVMLYGQHQEDTKLTLFIQMGLCGDTLADWITKRNNSPAVPGRIVVDGKMCLGIFRQILLAVQYIHSKNIIHRDLKPQNIFFTEDGTQIQLGDFGLARSLPDVSTSKTKVDSAPQNLCLTPVLNPTSNTGGVGTPIYAAPELKCGGNYGKKSDMHNLGIILLELFHPFQTGSERVHVISDLKIRRYLEPEFSVRWPDIAPLILELTSPDPSKRPAVSELLNLKLFSDEKLHFHEGEIVEVEASNFTEVEKIIDKQSFKVSELQDEISSLLKDELDVVANEASPALQSQMFLELQLANKEKDERIKKLSEENVILREIVAKLENQIHQINAVEQKQAALKHS